LKGSYWNGGGQDILKATGINSVLEKSLWHRIMNAIGFCWSNSMTLIYRWFEISLWTTAN
jgi:hypothetical protein